MTPPLLRVYGRPGTFGALTGRKVSPTGETLETIGIPSWAFPVGMSIGFIKIDEETGQVIIPAASTNGGGLISGDHLGFAVFDPARKLFTYSRVPTSKGFIITNSVTFDNTVNCSPTVKCYGGATVSEATPWTPSDGEPRFVLNDTFPYGNWDIDLYGLYPAVLVLKKDAAGVWVYDEELSRTADELAAMNAAGAAAFPAAFNSPCFLQPTGQTYHGTKGWAEEDVFPVVNHVLGGQYFAGQGGGASGWVFVLDDEAVPVVAYQFPDFYDPRGAVPPDPAAQRIGFAIRSVNVDSSSTDPTDLRFFVDPDIFSPTGRAITRVSRTNNYATFTTSVDHGWGIGMYARISGLANSGGAGATDADFNDDAFTNLRSPITAVSRPLGGPYTFTQRIAGVNVADHAVVGGTPLATMTTAYPIIELSYNSVAGTITPLSKPCFADVDMRSYGVASVDAVGNLWLNERGTVAFATGPDCVYLKDPGTGERRLVTEQPIVDTATWGVDSWNVVCEPDHKFAASAVGASLASGYQIDTVTGAVIHAGDDLRILLPDAVLERGTNLQANPGFESVTPNWQGFFTATVISWSASSPRTGAKCMRITRSDAGLGNPNTYSRDMFPLVPGQSYEVECYMRTPSVGVTGAIGILWWDGGGSPFRTDIGPVHQLPAGTWVKLRASFEVPDHAVFQTDLRQAVLASMYVQAYDVPGGGTYVEVDDCYAWRAPGNHLEPIDYGLDELTAIAEGSLLTLRGAVDETRRKFWLNIEQIANTASQAAHGCAAGVACCPGYTLDQWLISIELDPLLYGPTQGRVPKPVTDRPPLPPYYPQIYEGKTFGPVRPGRVT